MVCPSAVLLVMLFGQDKKSGRALWPVRCFCCSAYRLPARRSAAGV